MGCWAALSFWPSVQPAGQPWGWFNSDLGSLLPVGVCSDSPGLFSSNTFATWMMYESQSKKGVAYRSVVFHTLWHLWDPLHIEVRKPDTSARGQRWYSWEGVPKRNTEQNAHQRGLIQDTQFSFPDRMWILEAPHRPLEEAQTYSSLSHMFLWWTVGIPSNALEVLLLLPALLCQWNLDVVLLRICGAEGCTQANLEASRTTLSDAWGTMQIEDWTRIPYMQSLCLNLFWFISVASHLPCPLNSDLQLPSPEFTLDHHVFP